MSHTDFKIHSLMKCTITMYLVLWCKINLTIKKINKSANFNPFLSVKYQGCCRYFLIVLKTAASWFILSTNVLKLQFIHLFTILGLLYTGVNSTSNGSWLQLVLFRVKRNQILIYGKSEINTIINQFPSTSLICKASSWLVT